MLQPHELRTEHTAVDGEFGVADGIIDEDTLAMAILSYANGHGTATCVVVAFVHSGDTACGHIASTRY